jgi:hypothetical protein
MPMTLSSSTMSIKFHTMRSPVNHGAFVGRVKKYFPVINRAMMSVAEKRKRSLQTLIDAGVLHPLKRGRPPIYENDEERLAVLKSQKARCNKRHADRVKDARALFKERMRSASEAKNTTLVKEGPSQPTESS